MIIGRRDFVFQPKRDKSKLKLRLKNENDFVLLSVLNQVDGIVVSTPQTCQS